MSRGWRAKNAASEVLGGMASCILRREGNVQDSRIVTDPCWMKGRVRTRIWRRRLRAQFVRR